MKILLIILGAIMAIFGMTMICTPVATFLETGYFFAILLLVFGVISTIDLITEKKYNLNLAFALLTAIFGILLLAIPGFMLVADSFLVYIMAVWFILQGAVNIYTAVQGKKQKTKGWFWGILIGILDVIIGIYSVFHPMVLAFTLGILVGCYFIISGVQLIINGLKYKKEA
ncbi:MAG: DUF308 domain-containing protein [Firmicutes bacterium]|nr:DUF308 domain-containing protein [Bacillota bacterium]